MNTYKKDFTNSNIYQELQTLLLKDYFALFDLPPSFRIDQDTLTESYYQKQKIYHPDNYIKLTQSNVSQNLTALILQVSSHINDAYSALMHDLPRAITLLKIYGITLDFSKDTDLPQGFLLLQMEIYEALEEVKEDYINSKNVETASIRLEQIENQVQTDLNNLLKDLHHVFIIKDLNRAILLTKELSCYLKLHSRIMDVGDNITP